MRGRVRGQEEQLLCFHMRTFLLGLLRRRCSKALDSWRSVSVLRRACQIQSRFRTAFSRWRKVVHVTRVFVRLRLQRCSLCMSVWKHGCVALGLDADLGLELETWVRRWVAAKKIKCLSAWQGATIVSASAREGTVGGRAADAAWRLAALP